MGLSEWVKGMSVAWFSFNLATSAVALASYALGTVAGIALLVTISHIVAYVNTAVYALIASGFAWKTVIAKPVVLEELRHPVKGPFMSTISIATMLLALDWGIVLNDPHMGAVFFYTGMALHTALFIAIIYNFIMHEGVEIHAMNPGWYMPASGNVFIPYIGGFLEKRGIPVPHSLLGVYLGTGVVFWLALFTIWLYRSIFHHPPPARLLATTWINLAPPSIAPMAYEAMLGLLPASFKAATAELTTLSPRLSEMLLALFDLFYYTFWGLAGLLLAVILAVTITYIRRHQVEFAESWWAFVFPVASYSISTIHLYLHHPGERWLLYYAAALYGLTWIFYTVTTIYSIYYGYQELAKHRRPSQLPVEARPLPEEILEEEDTVQEE